MSYILKLFHFFKVPKFNHEDEGELVAPVHPVGLALAVPQDLCLHGSLLLGASHSWTFGT